jgi:hypothetical protein
MIAGLLLSMLIILSAQAIGSIFLDFLRITPNPGYYKKIIINIWLGLMLWSFILLYAGLFFALTPFRSALIIILAVSILWRLTPPEYRHGCALLANPQDSSATGGFFKILISTVFTGLLPVLLPSSLAETHEYQLNLLRWLSEHGSVYGMALLNEKMAATSSWYALFAPWNHGIMQGLFGALPGLLILMLLHLHFLIALINWKKNQYSSADKLVIFTTPLLIAICLHSGQANSLSPDMPTCFALLFTVWLFMEDKNSVLPLICGLMSLSLNIILLPLFLLLPGYHLIKQPRKRLRRFMILFTLTIIAVSPLAIHSLKSSGYLLYPFSSFSFDTPWTILNEAGYLQTATNRIALFLIIILIGLIISRFYKIKATTTRKKPKLLPMLATLPGFLVIFHLITAEPTQATIYHLLGGRTANKKLSFQSILLPPEATAPTTRKTPVAAKIINEIVFYLPDIEKILNGREVCMNAPLPCTSTELAERIMLLKPEEGLDGGFQWADSDLAPGAVNLSDRELMDRAYNDMQAGLWDEARLDLQKACRKAALEEAEPCRELQIIEAALSYESWNLSMEKPNPRQKILQAVLEIEPTAETLQKKAAELFSANDYISTWILLTRLQKNPDFDDLNTQTFYHETTGKLRSRDWLQITIEGDSILRRLLKEENTKTE